MMKNVFIVLLFLSFNLSAQDDNPYSTFGHQATTIKSSLEKKKDAFLIKNESCKQVLTFLIIDDHNKKALLFSENKYEEFDLDENNLARFIIIDPISGNYPELTPYQFASNRPVDGIDLDGLEYLRVNHEIFSNTTQRVVGKSGFLSGCTVIKRSAGDILRDQFDATYRKVNIAGQEYYDIGKHLYYAPGTTDFAERGAREYQATEATQVGIVLIANLDALPDHPAGYVAPDWNTKDPAEIQLSQNQALEYDDCEGVCYATTEARINNAYYTMYGQGVFDMTVSNSNPDHVSASGQTAGSYGVGEALVRHGFGIEVADADIWSGQLQTGASIQLWWKDNNKQHGHSVIFRSYEYSFGRISGINYTDYHGDQNRGLGTPGNGQRIERNVWENNPGYEVKGVNLRDREEPQTGN